MGEILMKTPSGGKSSIRVNRDGDGVSIVFSRTVDGELLVLLPRFAASKLADDLRAALSNSGEQQP